MCTIIIAKRCRRESLREPSTDMLQLGPAIPGGRHRHCGCRSSCSTSQSGAIATADIGYGGELGGHVPAVEDVEREVGGNREDGNRVASACAATSRIHVLAASCVCVCAAGSCRAFDRVMAWTARTCRCQKMKQDINQLFDMPELMPVIQRV